MGAGGGVSTSIAGNPSPGWKLLPNNSSTTPPGSLALTMAYDAADGYVLLYTPANWSLNGSTAQTWTFNGTGWTNITSTAGAAPPWRQSASMAYDAADGYVLLFGGTYGEYCGNGQNGSPASNPPGANCSLFPGPFAYAIYPNDTWTFAHGVWAKLTTSIAPPGRVGAQMAYDPATRSILLFGGLTGQGESSALRDTWSFSGGTWTDLTPSLPASPPARGLGGMAYDSTDGMMLLFGGATYISTPPFNWVFPYNLLLGDSWGYQNGTWTNLSRSGTLAPPPLWLFAMASDASGGVLLYGGMNGYSQVNGTWEYSNATWHYFPGLSSNPGSTVDSGAVFDPALNATLVSTADSNTYQNATQIVTIQSFTSWVWAGAQTGGVTSFSFPSLSISLASMNATAPTAVTVTVSASGGTPPYNLSYALGMTTTYLWFATIESNFTGPAGCPNYAWVGALPSGTSSANPYPGRNCPGSNWNGSAVVSSLDTTSTPSGVYVVGLVTDSAGNVGYAVALLGVLQGQIPVSHRPSAPVPGSGPGQLWLGGGVAATACLSLGVVVVGRRYQAAVAARELTHSLFEGGSAPELVPPGR